MSLYASLYEAHDSALAAQRAEAADQSEREAKRRALESGHEDLGELPALSSFLTLSDAAEGCAPKAEQDSSLGDKQLQRDGFERMQRCRLALDALDQVQHSDTLFRTQNTF